MIGFWRKNVVAAGTGGEAGPAATRGTADQLPNRAATMPYRPLVVVHRWPHVGDPAVCGCPAYPAGSTAAQLAGGRRWPR